MIQQARTISLSSKLPPLTPATSNLLSRTSSQVGQQPLHILPTPSARQQLTLILSRNLSHRLQQGSGLRRVEHKPTRGPHHRLHPAAQRAEAGLLLKGRRHGLQRLFFLQCDFEMAMICDGVCNMRRRRYTGRIWIQQKTGEEQGVFNSGHSSQYSDLCRFSFSSSPTSSLFFFLMRVCPLGGST